MILAIAAIAAALAFLAFTYRRSLRFLHIFQQEEYDGPRFRRWLYRNRLFDRRASLAILAATLIALAVAPAELRQAMGLLLIALALTTLSFFEPDPQRRAKKPLVLTPRARRILGVHLALVAVLGSGLGALLLGVSGAWANALAIAGLILIVQTLGLALTGANRLLAPAESRVRRRILNEARSQLDTYAPYVIGITGSYGKTSAKHILGHVLSTFATTLITPASVNTPMGIARVIREQLRPEHRYFIVEMGAYGPGSIARLCALTPPKLGIITAVGWAHYERFKTLDTVADTKFELADAAMAAGGAVVANGELLEQRIARARITARPEAFRLYGGSEPLAGAQHLTIEDMEQTHEGLSFTLHYQGAAYPVRLPLFGVHQVGNAAAAFAAAVELGLPPEGVVSALRTVPQIRHRLEVIEQAPGVTLIDDAYNSNPTGFAAALALLDQLGRHNGGRRILITPGMVEMGAAHERSHRDLGEQAGAVVDVALIIQPTRIPTFMTGLQETAGSEAHILTRDTFAEAKAWLDEHLKTGDVILLENDLPDLYERRLVL